MTRRQKVWMVLDLAARLGHGVADGRRFECEDGWVDGHRLCAPDVGGSEGLRRVRELRTEGWQIEMRPHPVHGRTSRQYRLVRPGQLSLDEGAS